MGLSTLLLIFGISAIIMTILVTYVFKKSKSLLMTFLQNFCGVWFLFSGWVKAVDPLGSAYKMTEYFEEFQVTFEGTMFSFIAPVFELFNEYSVAFSVGMIVLEIVLGIMLIIGARPKLTSWIFFMTMVIFTALTGYTFLTGFVPMESNFFSFGEWESFVKSNMRVKDCGCFGDFIQLDPRTSFFKDIFLMLPAFYFILNYNKMYQLFTSKWRDIITIVSIIGTTLYCYSNYAWDIPHEDFRPFRVGVDVNEQRELEEQAQANVKILGWIFENTETGQVVEEMNPDYMAVYKNYPKDEGWKVQDQIKTEPTLEVTKITEFEVSNYNGDDLTEEVLHDPNYSIMIVSYKLKGHGVSATKTVVDSIFTLDTIYVDNSDEIDRITENLVDIVEVELNYTDYIWDKEFYNAYKDVINPFATAAEKDGLKVYAVVGAGEEEAMDLIQEIGLDFDFYQADDILLKTIIRSNPGVVLWKNGEIIYKWHYKKLPDFSEVKKRYIK